MTGGPMTVEVGAVTHPGLRRALNEDSVIAEAPVFVVADGMGGHEAGEVASAAVTAAFSSLRGLASVAVDDLRRVLDRARADVEALADGAGLGAGTTVAGVAVAEHAGSGYWLVVNIGDSRVYRFSQGALEQISVDHSVVQELIEDGAITASEARRHPERNVVTRAIGAGSDGEADFWLLPAATGDRMLVCSDGLSGEVEDAAIAAVLGSSSNAPGAAAQLVEAALAAGARDNVSVIVVDAVDVVVADMLDDEDGDTLPRAPVEEGNDASV